jgi:hypothetical protein
MIIKYITFLIGIIWSYSIIKTQSVFSKKAGIIFIAACYFGYKKYNWCYNWSFISEYWFLFTKKIYQCLKVFLNIL